MDWTKSEKQIWAELEQWQKKMYTYQPTDFERTYEKWLENSFSNINEDNKKKLFENIDSWLFHLHSYIQGTDIQLEARTKIINEAKVFNHEVTEIVDLRNLSIQQLTYLADKHLTKSQYYSMIQGGLAGTGGLLLLGIDLPAVAIINLRAVQLIAMSFGYDIRYPHEMMLSLKIFHLATLPKRLRHEGWTKLVREIETLDHDVYISYDGDDNLTNETWLDQPIKHLIKSLVIFMFRKKLIQGIPIVGIAVGATTNYRLTKRVNEFAIRFYQLRHLLEKEKH